MKRNVKLLFLFLARSIGLFTFSRALTGSQLRILCYHGGCISDEADFNPKLFLKTETFRNRMLWLKDSGFSVISLNEALSPDTLESRPLRVAVTFDDGWHSTGANLIPIMTELSLPSTLYLCTKHYVEAWPVLPVALRYILWKSTQQDAEIVGFDSEIDGYYVLQSTAQRNELAHKIFLSIEKLALDKLQVEEALDRFAACLGVSRSDSGFRKGIFNYMTADELRSASSNGCSIELHGHVHDYPIGDPIRFKKDLMMCAEVIDSLGLPKPKHYCYPAGVSDGNAPTVLRDLGVISATTCRNSFVSKSDKEKRYYLPRFLDGENVSMLEFQSELSGFSEIIRSCIRIMRRKPVPHKFTPIIAGTQTATDDCHSFEYKT